MLNQLIVARSLTRTDHVDLVRAGRRACAFEAWLQRITEGSARRAGRLLRCFNASPAKANATVDRRR